MTVGQLLGLLMILGGVLLSLYGVFELFEYDRDAGDVFTIFAGAAVAVVGNYIRVKAR